MTVAHRARAALIRAFAEAHEKRGLTTQDMANKIGRSPEWVERTLMGRGKLTLDFMSDLAMAMEAEIEYSPRERRP